MQVLCTCAGWLRGAFFGGVSVLEVENVLGEPTPSLSLVNRQSAGRSVWKLDFPDLSCDLAPSASPRAHPHFLPKGSGLCFLQVPENVKAEVLEGKKSNFS